MPASIRINTVAGSDESAVDFDGSTSITLDSSPAATNYQWEFLDWPLDSSYTQTWLTSTWGATNPTVVFTPDRAGTWVVKLTDTNDSSTDTIVVGVRNRKTNIRVPGATETTETDNINYDGVANHRGWALERNKSLRDFDDLVTAGGIQTCYLDDAAVGGGVDAGTLVSLELNGAQEIDPTTNEVVPTVKLTQATFASDNYRFYGVIRAGRVGAAANPGSNQFEYDTTRIQNQTFIQVSRAGSVTGGAVGTLNLSTTTKGQILFASATAGGVTTDADRFADSPPEIMIPVGYVAENANPGTMVVMPNMAYTGPTDQNEIKFLGIGDFSVLRVGNVPTAGYTSIAAEESPSIEVVGVNQESVTINQGTVVSINSNGVYKADSSLDPDVSVNRLDGIFGIAVENVTAGSVGHFTIFGRVPNVLTTGASAGLVLYVGSSTADSGDLSGRAVRKTTIQLDSYSDYGNEMIPLGIWDGSELMLGIIQDDGILGTLESSRKGSNGDFGKSTNQTTGNDVVSINNANVYKTSTTALVDLPNTRSENQPVAISLFEAEIKGEDLYDVDNNRFGVISYSGGMDVPGAALFNGTWNPTGGGAPAANVLYGTFQFDERLFKTLTPTEVIVYGYTDDGSTGNVILNLSGRFNVCNAADIGVFDFTNSSSENLNNTSTNDSLQIKFNLADDSSGEKYYLLPPDGSDEIVSLDITLERTDANAAGFLIDKVVLVGITTYQFAEELDTLFEYKKPAYALIDSSSSNFNVVDDEATVGNNETLGIKMSDAYGAGATSEIIGFLAIDNRFNSSNRLYLEIVGKYQGAAGGAQSIDLDVTYRLEYCNTEYNADITVGGTTLTTISKTPAGASSPNYEVLCFTAGIVGPFTTTNLAGIRYKIERSGTNPLTNGAGEDFFQISNVGFHQASNQSPLEYPEVFEQQSELCNSYDNNGRAYNDEVDTDFSGFLFSSGGSEELYYFVSFDKRYDFRQDLEVDIIGYITAANDEISLDVAIDSWYYDGTPLADAGYSNFTTVTVDTSAYAANNRVLCHQFRVPASSIWGGTVPTWADMNTSYVDGVMLKITRSDASAGKYVANFIKAKTSTGSATTKTSYIRDINGEYTDHTKYLTELFAQRQSGGSTFLASVNRQSFVFGADGSSSVAGGGGSLELSPSGFMGGSGAGGGRFVGHFIPYSMAITHVHGWGLDASANNYVLTGCTLTFTVKTLTGGAVTNDGVVNLPLTATFQSDGSILWNGTSMNFNGSDTTNIPVIYLPEDYRTLSQRWGLECEFSNTTGNAIELLSNITVEVNLVPSTLDLLNG